MYCLATGICWAYVLSICMHDAHNHSLIIIALSVVRLLSELLEAFLVLLVSPADITLILVFSC